jgi:glutaredoxin 3
MFGIFKRKDKAKETTAQQPATVTPADTDLKPPAMDVKPPAASVIKIYTIALDQSCKMARDLLAERGLKYEEIDVTGNGSLISWLRRETDEVTFPRVFVYGKHIGGYEQLRSLEYSGALDKLIRGEGIDEFLKEEDAGIEENEWTAEKMRENLRSGKILSLKREDGLEVLMWAEVFSNPPAVFYEGKKYPVSEFDRILAEIMELIDKGEATADWQEED